MLSRGFFLAAAFSFLASLLALAPPADAGHTYQSGTCWKPGTPLLCRVGYVLNTWLTIRLVDEFTDQRPDWWTPFETAMWAWNDASGPQSLHYVPQPNDSWIFVRDQPSTPGLAYTVNCNTSQVCTSWAAIDIWYTNVDIDRGQFPGYYEQQVSLFAHEFGHGLGLMHHNQSNYLMHQSMQNPPITGPSPGEVGLAQCPSSLPSAWGIRCIYNWPY